MKKDTYPDIRIEVLSEGLAKKILGKVEDAPPSVYGEEKPTSTTIPDINAKGVNREMAEILETSNKKPNYTAIVKEAINELRKAPDTAYDPMGGVSGTKSRKTKDVLATPGPASSVYEEAQMAGIDPTGARRPEREDPKGRADVKEALASAPEAVTSRENVYQEAQSAGITPYQTFGGGTAAPTGEEAEYFAGSPYSRMTDPTPETIDYRPQDKTTRRDSSSASISDISAQTGTGTERTPKGFDPSSVSATAAAAAAKPTGGAGAKSKTGDFDTGYGTRETGTKGTGTSAGDKGKGPSGPTGDSGLVGYKPIGEPSDTVVEDLTTGGDSEEVVEEEPSVEEVSGKVAADVTGIDPTIIDEIDKPVGQINSEITRPNNPTDSSKKLPQFGSSGYFDAVLQIGEGNTIERDGGQVPLSSVNYGVNSLAEFLELYPQNETFDKDKFLDTLTTEKSITKAQNPKSITAKPTANVNGVNVSSTVVSGAGTMKTLEKTGKGLNKPKELGASKKTRATKINPKNIQTKAVMKSERPAMDNTLSYIIKEAIEEIKIDKARKTSKDIGSRMGPQRKETEGGEAGKSWSQRAEYRGDIANMAKAALEKQGADDPSTFSSQRQAYGDTTTAQMDKTTGLREGSAFKRMGDTGTDAYGSEEQFIVNPDKGVGPQEVSVPKLNTRPEVYRGQ